MKPAPQFADGDLEALATIILGGTGASPEFHEADIFDPATDEMFGRGHADGRVVRDDFRTAEVFVDVAEIHRWRFEGLDESSIGGECDQPVDPPAAHVPEPMPVLCVENPTRFVR